MYLVSTDSAMFTETNYTTFKNKFGILVEISWIISRIMETLTELDWQALMTFKWANWPIESAHLHRNHMATSAIRLECSANSNPWWYNRYI
mgnify:CR=1 FL=1